MSKNTTRKKKKMEHWEFITLILMAYDFLAVVLSYFAALWIRFDVNTTVFRKSICKRIINSFYLCTVLCSGFLVSAFV